jgi:hypothetical protein
MILKGHKVAVGSKQCTFDGYKNSNGASPTVSTSRVIITTAIHTNEGHDSAIIDIPGAYLHAKKDKKILMCLRGKLLEMMVRVYPQRNMSPPLQRVSLSCTSISISPCKVCLRGPYSGIQRSGVSLSQWVLWLAFTTPVWPIRW